MVPSHIFLRVEQQSPNDEWYEVKELLAASGGSIVTNQVVATLEGSKTAFDIEAPQGGFFFTAVAVGDRLRPGSVLGVIAPTENFDIESIASPERTIDARTSAADEIDLRSSSAARELARRHDVDISRFSHLDYVTTEDIYAFLGRDSKRLSEEVFSAGVSIERLAVIGAGRGAVQILDAVTGSPKQRIVCYFDDIHFGTDELIAGVPIVGQVDIGLIVDKWKSGMFDKCVISISSNIEFRTKTFEKLKEFGMPFGNIIHPAASLGLDVLLGDGNVILANCNIGAMARIGCNNFVSAGCNLEHHCAVGSHNTFGPVVVTSGNVQIGDENRFGSGIFVEPRLKIGSRCIVSSGAVLTRAVADDTVVVYKTPLLFRKRALTDG